MGLHLNENGVGRVTGVFFCDSAWLCKPCARRRALERAERISEVYDALSAGVIENETTGERIFGTMPMITLTIRHDLTMQLAAVKAAVMKAWLETRRGAPWARVKEKYKVLGVLTAPEVTWSWNNGWHFHLHVAVPALCDKKMASELGAWILARYLRYIKGQGFDALIDGQDVTIPDDEKAALDYMAKGVHQSRQSAWELAGGTGTKDRTAKDSLSPFDILERAHGDKRMAALFREYAEVMPGTRACIITKSLADKLKLTPVEDEEEPGLEEAEHPTDPIGFLPSPIWRALMNKALGGTVLARLEDVGADGWLEVEALAFKLAGVRPLGQWSEITNELPEFRPPEDWVAREVIALEMTRQVRPGGRKWGRSLGQVLDRLRGEAVRSGRKFIPPDLQKVLSLIAAQE